MAEVPAVLCHRPSSRFPCWQCRYPKDHPKDYPKTTQERILALLKVDPKITQRMLADV